MVRGLFSSFLLIYGRIRISSSRLGCVGRFERVRSGTRSVQSLPRRENTRTPSASRRQTKRYPSRLISYAHYGPLDAGWLFVGRHGPTKPEGWWDRGNTAHVLVITVERAQRESTIAAEKNRREGRRRARICRRSPPFVGSKCRRLTAAPSLNDPAIVLKRQRS